MSKSVGNVVDPALLVERFGPDPIRYYLMRDMIVGQDADFSEDRLIALYNAELANDLGNLLNRTINMSQRYRSGILRSTQTSDTDLASIRESVSIAIARYKQAFEGYQVHLALEAVRELVAKSNALVELKAPWKLAKDPASAELLDGALYTLAETCRILVLLVSPIIPASSAKMLAQLNAEKASTLAWGDLTTGHKIGAPSPVFPRIELSAEHSG
jgi:methionyl-tRNA synthetase